MFTPLHEVLADSPRRFSLSVPKYPTRDPLWDDLATQWTRWDTNTTATTTAGADGGFNATHQMFTPEAVEGAFDTLITQLEEEAHRRRWQEAAERVGLGTYRWVAHNGRQREEQG